MDWLTAAAFILGCSQLWINGVTSASIDRSSKFLHGGCLPDATSPSIGDRAVCTFSRIIDHDPNRIPRDVAFVRCRCPGVLCNSVGDFRCQEVRDTLQVAYRQDNGVLKNGTLEISVSCVCVTARSMASHTATLTPDDSAKDLHKAAQPTQGGTHLVHRH